MQSDKGVLQSLLQYALFILDESDGSFCDLLAYWRGCCSTYFGESE